LLTYLLYYFYLSNQKKRVDYYGSSVIEITEYSTAWNQNLEYSSMSFISSGHNAVCGSKVRYDLVNL